MTALPCTVNPEWWFADARDDEATLLAKDACSGCPERHDCLTGALERDERFGIFGGLTPEERVLLVRQRGAS